MLYVYHYHALHPNGQLDGLIPLAQKVDSVEAYLSVKDILIRCSKLNIERDALVIANLSLVSEIDDDR